MKTRYAFVIIAVVSILIYANSLNNAFQYDDQVYLEENTNIKTIGLPDIFLNPSSLFAPNTTTGHYRPLVLLMHVMNYRIHGLNPFGYHVVNLAFHVGSAVLLFLIVRAMLSGGMALTAALIFAVHPFNSEVVNYITARSSVMSGFFYLLAFYCWVRYRNNPPLSPFNKGGLRGIFYVASLLAFLPGMLSKEVVITLPIVLWLYDLYFVHPVRTPHSAFRTLFSWRTYLPYFPFVLAVVVPMMIIRIIYWGGVAPSFKRPLPVQLYTELPVLVKHLRLFIFPVGLNVDHYAEIYRSFFAWPVAVSAFILLVYLLLAAAAYRARSSEWRVVSFFMIWFFIVLLPTIVIPLNAIFQENRGYLAMIVFPVFAGVMLGKLTKIPLNPPFSKGEISSPPLEKGGEGGFERLFSSKVRNYASVVILIILVLSYGAGTVYRNGVWRNGISLWSDAVAKSPESSLAHTNLGTGYAQQGRNDKAIEHFLKALRFSDPLARPHLANIHYNLGTTYQQMGRDDMAMGEYKVVAEISPSDFRPHYNLGVLYQQVGEDEAALEAYRAALKRHPSDFRSYHNIGLLYQNRGETALAAGFYRKALSINPDYVKSRVNLEAIYGQNRR